MTNQSNNTNNATGTVARTPSASQAFQRTAQSSMRKKQKRHSPKGKGKPTAVSSRKPAGPVYTYLSVCCGVQALKPRAASEYQAKDPETGKVRKATKGLGHWRCTSCRKSCKVRPTKPQPKEVANVEAQAPSTVVGDGVSASSVAV